MGSQVFLTFCNSIRLHSVKKMKFTIIFMVMFGLAAAAPSEHDTVSEAQEIETGEEVSVVEKRAGGTLKAGQPCLMDSDCEKSICSYKAPLRRTCYWGNPCFNAPCCEQDSDCGRGWPHCVPYRGGRKRCQRYNREMPEPPYGKWELARMKPEDVARLPERMKSTDY